MSDLERFLLQEPAAAPPILLRLMVTTGLPWEFLEGHVDYVESHVQKPDFDRVAFRRTSPVFAAWVAQHPTYTAAVSEAPVRRRVVRQRVRSLVDMLKRICARRRTLEMEESRRS
ncbi:MAG: hypothetical protein NTNFB02_10380 [Nitrospira sp.]